MHLIVILYSTLILLAAVTASFSVHAYTGCPSNRSPRPLILPIICSVGWFIVGVDQLIQYATQVVDSSSEAAIITLTIATLAALLYFVIHYLRERHLLCHIHSQE